MGSIASDHVQPVRGCDLPFAKGPKHTGVRVRQKPGSQNRQPDVRLKNIPYFEATDLHRSAANMVKAGEYPLTDTQCSAWLGSTVQIESRAKLRPCHKQLETF